MYNINNNYYFYKYLLHDNNNKNWKLHKQTKKRNAQIIKSEN